MLQNKKKNKAGEKGFGVLKVERDGFSFKQSD